MTANAKSATSRTTLRGARVRATSREKPEARKSKPKGTVGEEISKLSEEELSKRWAEVPPSGRTTEDKDRWAAEDRKDMLKQKARQLKEKNQLAIENVRSRALSPERREPHSEAVARAAFREASSGSKDRRPSPLPIQVVPPPASDVPPGFFGDKF